MGTEQELGRGKYLTLCVENSWEYVRRQFPVVVIVALTDNDELVLVEQFRPAVKKKVIELPAGLVGDLGEKESPDLAARRELLEETGFQAKSFERMFRAASAPGMSSELLWVYRATGLERVGPGGGDDSENITVHVIPRADVPRWLMQQQQEGCLIDMRVYSGLSLATVADDALSGW